MNCIQCGNAIDNDAAWCPNCGSRVDNQPVQTQPVQPVAQPEACLLYTSPSPRDS